MNSCLTKPNCFASASSEDSSASPKRKQDVMLRGSHQRFTQDGSDELENHLQHIVDLVKEGVSIAVPASRLEGVILAGGYGRGEGGVLRTPDGNRPYNDLEFYVFIRGCTLLTERAYHSALHNLGERLTPVAGIEVEFKILSLAKLRASEVSMFSYDFVMKHRVVSGDGSMFAACAHHREVGSIPQHEATRLLFNRCTGLLFSAERLRRKTFTAEDADFVGRNIAKAQLGIGDAVLASMGHYHWSCEERHDRLKKMAAAGMLDSGKTLVRLHEAGVSFKLKPRQSNQSREELAAQHEELSKFACAVWLKLESKRLKQCFPTAHDYGFSQDNKCPEQPGWRNMLVSARTFGLRSLADSRGHCYPRQRLFHAMALLLWEDREDAAVKSFVQHELRATSSNFNSLISAYEKLWHRFN